MPLSTSFPEQLARSHGSDNAIEAILLANFPGAVSVHKSHQSNDRKGTDFWVELCCGTHLSVDVKARAEDWSAKDEPNAADDLALETWPVVERKKIGWTRDETKRTDYVLWYWQDSAMSQ